MDENLRVSVFRPPQLRIVIKEINGGGSAYEREIVMSQEIHQVLHCAASRMCCFEILFTPAATFEKNVAES